MSKLAFPKTDRLREMREAKHKRDNEFDTGNPGPSRPMTGLIEQLTLEQKAMLILPDLAGGAKLLGSKGGKSKSPAKIAAVRLNGKKGGRPANGKQSA